MAVLIMTTGRNSRPHELHITIEEFKHEPGEEPILKIKATDTFSLIEGSVPMNSWFRFVREFNEEIALKRR